VAKEKAKSPRMYIYLDSDGIESLYAQTVERLETELTQSREHDKSGTVKANIGIGRLLGSMIGLVDMGAATELSISGKQVNEAKMRFTLEQKLSALIQYLQSLEGKEFFDYLPQAAIQAEKQGEGVFISVAEKFSMPQFSQGDGVSNINRDQAISFTIGQTDKDHEFSDTYFKKTQYTFFMTASLNKTTRSREGMRATGHDAIFFREHKGKDVPLNVFGYLIPLSKYTYQIKPYAIWIM
jgi:hypothetical protein